MYRLARLIVASMLLPALACNKAPTPSLEAKAQEKPTSIEDIAPAEAVVSAKVVEAAAELLPPAQTPITYSAAIEPLLDLVPDANGHFIMVRDPSALLGVFDAAIQTAVPLLAEQIAGENGEAELKEVRAVVEGLAGLRDALIEVKVDLDRGVLLLEDQEAIIYATGSEDPNALKVALKAVGVDASKLPPTCVAPPAMPGFAACGDDEAVLKSLKPGKHGKALRKEFEDGLKGFDVLRGNAFARLDADGKPLLASLSTPPGEAHLVMGLSALGPEVNKYIAAGPADSLGLLHPGAAFVWGRLQMSAFTEQLKGAPPPVQNVVGSLTGEYVMGGLRDSSALVALLGVDDPAMAAGAIALASMQKDALKRELPDGSVVESLPIEIGESTVQSLHLELAIPQAQAKSAKALGIEPHAYWFAAGKFGGAVVGAREDAVKQVAAFEGGAKTPVGPPASLVRTMSKGEAAFAIHLPFDALQSAPVRDAIKQLVTADMAEELGGFEPNFDIFSPFSALSLWVTQVSDTPVLHISLETFADGSSEEGKAALDAMGKVLAGGDPATLYGKLAETYPTSPRIGRYRARAVKSEDGLAPGALSSFFVIGVAAGVTIPAFTSYMAAARGVAPPPALEAPAPPPPPPAE